ncbi:MAG: hypothetical protein DCC56_15985 [Anaerolineae bacterium]|nr:MAG: hypothetical protein DCC56_15985 [Anaerolineae bacterium]
MVAAFITRFQENPIVLESVLKIGSDLVEFLFQQDSATNFTNLHEFSLSIYKTLCPSYPLR